MYFKCDYKVVYVSQSVNRIFKVPCSCLAFLYQHRHENYYLLFVPANCKPGTVLVTALSQIFFMYDLRVMVAGVCNQTSSIFRHALLKDSEQL